MDTKEKLMVTTNGHEFTRMFDAVLHPQITPIQGTLEIVMVFTNL